MMITGIFTKAIQTTLDCNGNCRAPEMFKRYIRNNNLNINGTAQHISIQSFSQLNAELKNNNLMVFRLGSRAGKNGTYFSLARTINGWKDYFLFDEDIFDQNTTEKIIVDWTSDQYLSFSVIPKLTETSHVNLALVSGILEKALELDSNVITIPATGRGNYTFNVKPNSELNTTWEHNSGQVEIDSIFIGTRNSKKYIIIIEAKSGKYPDSLAKHKLVYPILAIAPKIPNEYEVMPVYMRIEENSNSLIFFIAECKIPRPEEISINQLVCKSSKIMTIPK